MTPLRRLHIMTASSMAALGLLCLAWETVLAPMRPGGTWLALKALPILLALPALWAGRLRAYQWWSMLILVYLCEGVVRALSDSTDASRLLGWAEAALAALSYGLLLGYCRTRRTTHLPA